MTVTAVASPRVSTRFRATLGATAVLGLGVRLWAVEFFYRALPLGFSDNFFYSVQANALAEGHGYLDPFLWSETGLVEPSASHTPLYSTYLAAWSFLGLDSATWHRVASSFLGVATVVLVGLVARRLAGDRAGLIAAAAAALFPPLWITDGTIVAESLYAPMTALVMLAGLRLADRRDTSSAAVLGLTIALTALTRSEGVALLVLLVVPLVVVLRPLTWPARARVLAVSWTVCFLVIAPWTIRNLAAFEEPTPLAYGAGYVMRYGNCDATYRGDFLGYWSVECAYTGTMEPDMSVGERVARAEALEYIGDNLERVPVVVAARVGRLWHLYRPLQTTDFDVLFERRGRFPSDASLAAFYVVAPLALVGAWALRRHRAGLVVTGAMIASATLSAAIAFGITRYRIAGDVALVVLAGVGIDRLVGRMRRSPPTAATDGRDDHADAEPAPVAAAPVP
jgi:4-amino-4-deoxy-L-arabinose transferase-like glycosyltransferase